MLGLLADLVRSLFSSDEEDEPACRDEDQSLHGFSNADREAMRQADRQWWHERSKDP